MLISFASNNYKTYNFVFSVPIGVSRKSLLVLPYIQGSYHKFQYSYVSHSVAEEFLVNFLGFRRYVRYTDTEIFLWLFWKNWKKSTIEEIMNLLSYIYIQKYIILICLYLIGRCHGSDTATCTSWRSAATPTLRTNGFR